MFAKSKVLQYICYCELDPIIHNQWIAQIAPRQYGQSTEDKT